MQKYLENARFMSESEPKEKGNTGHLSDGRNASITSEHGEQY